MRSISSIFRWAAVLAIAAASIARAHVTHPMVYMSDREAVVQMTSGAKKHSVREVRLAPAERRAIEARWGWKASEALYRFYLGRDESGRLVSAVTFLTEHTIHGPIRIAVALDRDGKVKDARIVEVGEEMLASVRPLVTGRFFQQFVGLDSSGNFTEAAARLLPQEKMVQFFGELAAQLVQHGTILFDVAFLRRGEM